VSAKASRLAGVVSVAVLATLAPGAARTANVETPRLLVGLAATGHGATVRVKLRNLAVRPVSLRSLTRVSLRRVSTSGGASGPGAAGPDFWAPLDLRFARSPETSQPQYVRLGPSEAREIVVELKTLAWAEGACACWPDSPLGRVVVPGPYELLIEIQDPDSGFWWRSNVIDAVMKPNSLEVSSP
jgi:hypothetical protein